MKFIVSRDALYKNLTAINGVLASSNSTMPILENFLFTVENNTLTLTASDLETTMSAVLQLSNVEGEGSVAIPSKTLIETLKLIPETPIVFDIDEENERLKFSAVNGEYDSSCKSGKDFPELKKIEDPRRFEIDAPVLQRAISKTLFATGNDELRPNMMGVFCALSENDITFVATDAHKLVRYTHTSVKCDEPTSFILSKKPLIQLKNVLTGLEEKIQVEYSTDSNHVRFEFANIVLFSSLKEGNFPPYQNVIPVESPNKLVVSRKDFHKTISRVCLYSNQSTYQVRLSLSDEKINVTAEDMDYSSKADEDISGVYTGTNMQIGFNSKFLREMIENMDCDEISIEMSEPNRAALILPTTQYCEQEDLLMLIMPVMLSY